MRRTLNGGVVVVLAAILLSTPALADPVMDRIRETGTIRIGFRQGSIPFAFVDPKTGKHAGFSVDMAHELARYLGMRFGKRIRIEPFPVTSKTRIPMVVDGAIDIEMGSTTYTQEREERADFSMVFFFSETTFLVARGSGISSLQDLNGLRVGAARSTTNLEVIRKLEAEGRFSPGEIVVPESHLQGMAALRSGKIDAYSTDRSLLEGLRIKDQNPDKWMTTPFAVAYEPYAYIIGEGHSDFRDFVNNTIIWSIHKGTFFELYEKWMGPQGVVPIPMSEAYRDYLEMMVYPISDQWWKRQ